MNKYWWTSDMPMLYLKLNCEQGIDMLILKYYWMRKKNDKIIFLKLKWFGYNLEDLF